MIDVFSYLPANRKNSSSGWISFNAPCCVHNGESEDQRRRGGIKVNDQGWSYHCFNCGYTASFVLGRNVTYKARKLLQWLHVPVEEIDRINLESLKHRSALGMLDDRIRVLQALQDIKFDEAELPPYSVLITPESPEYQYLENRHVPLNYPYMMEDVGRLKNQYTRPAIIIPFTYHNTIVGSAKRFLDDRNPRYLNDMQPGYVFGTDLQQNSWQHVIVVEGVFDALCIDGLAVLHADINDAQARLIRSLGREVTVVPDQDLAGVKLIDRALELGWAVSVPDWGVDVKDVNDAVKKYGKFSVMSSIFAARNVSKIKIEIAKRSLVKKLNG